MKNHRVSGRKEIIKIRPEINEKETKETIANIISEMAPHSSTLAWKSPWTEEPGRLQSTELLRVGHD